MTEKNSIDSGLKKPKRGPQKAPKRIIEVKVRLTEQEATSMALEAYKAGYRKASPNLWKHPSDEFEPIQDTRGISKFLRKACFPSWLKGEAERAMKKKVLQEQAQELGYTLKS